jgi:phenylacetic acid degradation operon negative regulatory protein
MSETPIDAMLDRLAEKRRLNVKSLIVTVFGDAILPHGASVWLGSLVQMLALCGINERGVRTSIFRLTKEGWFSAQPVGRRSYYSLTHPARLRFEAAHRTIYAASPAAWDGMWTIVLTGLFEPAQRERLRADLAWQGFGQILPGVMLHPAPDVTSLREALKEAGRPEQSPVMRATSEAWMDREGVRAIVARAWKLESLAAQYDEFLAGFRPFLRALDNGTPSPETCFRLRTMLIHHYRRALLRDPGLPAELLPPHWPGAAARLLCRNLYRLVQAGAETYLSRTLETADGPAPDADRSYFERFGGLAPLDAAG